VTLRRAALLPSFRAQLLIQVFEESMAKASRGAFRLVEYSIQSDHVHLLVEAADNDALSRGVQGLAIRLARTFNRAIRRRGKVWGDRYHARALHSPREVRAGIVYVLMNHKKHRIATVMTNAGPLRDAGVMGPLDAFSSAAWFEGFAPRAGPYAIRLRDALPMETLPVVRPRTWLLRAAWKRHGLIGPEERPARRV
jgi:putative transposase